MNPFSDFVNDLSNLNMDHKNKNYNYQIDYFNRKFQIDISKYNYLNDLFVCNQTKHNEIAVIGDSYIELNCHHANFLLKKTKGEMDKFRQQKLNNEYFSLVCDKLFLDDIDKILIAQSSIYTQKMKATFLEAIIGVMYLNNEEKLLSFIKNNILKLILI